MCVGDGGGGGVVGVSVRAIYFLHFNVTMSKRAQIHRHWEGARISDKALRRSGRWRDQRRSNRRRVPEWGRVPVPSTACVTQHKADQGAVGTLCPNQAEED